VADRFGRGRNVLGHKLRIFDLSNIMENVQNLLRSYKANVFQALAHPTRIAIIEALREGELSAGAIQERLSVEQANLSQHLAILRTRQLVTNRKEGNQVFYSLRQPVLIKVLDIMRRYFQSHLNETVQMLHQIAAEERGVANMAMSRKEK
jgi:DNA-binding transcriptional ArsR family regulator